MIQKKLDAKTWRQIIICYEALGGRSMGSKGDIIRCPSGHWRSPAMSPFVLSPRGNIKNQLQQVTAFFQRHSPKRSPDGPQAHVQLVGVESNDAHHPRLITAQAMGWRMSRQPNTLNAWSGTLPLKVPKNIHISFGNYFDRRLYGDFIEVMGKNFKSTPQFIRELNAMVHEIEDRVKTIVLYHDSGKIAGAGLVASAGGGGFLFCGAISKPYRGKGLWRVLVSARQKVSGEMGANFWVTTTRSRRILGKGEFSYPLTLLTQSFE